MSARRLRLLALVIILSLSQSIAKDKTKNSLPDYVLKARTVVIVVAPESARPLTDPIQNRTVQEDVEKAFVQWGRLQPVYNVQSADLVVAVRKGIGRTRDSDRKRRSHGRSFGSSRACRPRRSAGWRSAGAS